MEKFQCSECGLTSAEQSKINEHMQKYHNIQVVQEDIAKSFFCSLCSFKSKNMNYFKDHMIGNHEMGEHQWWTEDIRLEYYCDECEIELSQREFFVEHMENNHSGDTVVKSEHYKIEVTGGNSKIRDTRPGMEAFEDDRVKTEPTGMTMKGKGMAFQDACIALKQEMIKGRIFKDDKGRKLTILEAPKGTGPIDVEITTISNKPNEKRGNAKLMLHKPNIKRGATIQASLFSGSQFVFVKVLMNKFITPFIDCLINGSKKSLLDLFKEGPDNKPLVKDKPKVKVEEEVKCDTCDTIFSSNHGLRIHIGKVHKEDKSLHNKRKRSDILSSDENAIKKRKIRKLPEGVLECEFCETKFKYIKSFEWHLQNCSKKSKEAQDLRSLSNENKVVIEVINEKVISKSCQECDSMIEAKDFRSLLESIQSHNYSCKEKIETSTTNKTLSSQKQIDEVVKGVEEMNVKEKTFESSNKVLIFSHCKECSFKTNKTLELEKHIELEHNINDNSKIPERLGGLLSMKGISIQDHRLIHTSGGGLCGANSVSLHATGSEANAQDIRENVNQHLVNNWELLYKDSYEFPYTERVGVSSKTFQNELEFLRFLREEDEASTLWMTHVDMQAASTMLNINIQILTTGLSPPSSHRCRRCKPGQMFNTEEDLIIHTEVEHHRTETQEAREGRRQNARWTELKPDLRISNNSAAEIPEELILLHEDDNHYNLIVHKNHNAFRKEEPLRKHMPNHKKHIETIFGDFAFTTNQNPKTFAEMTKKSISSEPEKILLDKQEVNKADLGSLNNPDESEDGWQKVTNKGKKVSPKKQKVQFILPTQNRFSDFNDASEEIVNSSDTNDTNVHSCGGCGYSFQTKEIMEDHKRSAHGNKSKKGESDEDDKDKLIKELQQQINREKKASKEVKTAYETLEKEYRACEQVLSIVQEENSRFKIAMKDMKSLNDLKDTEKNKNVSKVCQTDIDKSVNYQCEHCDFPFRDKLKLNLHVNKHQIVSTEEM